jgi:hypothetical protein
VRARADGEGQRLEVVREAPVSAYADGHVLRGAQNRGAQSTADRFAQNVLRRRRTVEASGQGAAQLGDARDRVHRLTEDSR